MGSFRFIDLQARATTEWVHARALYGGSYCVEDVTSCLRDMYGGRFLRFCQYPSNTKPKAPQ